MIGDLEPGVGGEAKAGGMGRADPALEQPVHDRVGALPAVQLDADAVDDRDRTDLRPAAVVRLDGQFQTAVGHDRVDRAGARHAEGDVGSDPLGDLRCHPVAMKAPRR
ncbi:MAG: hypothetical protein ABSH51_13040 [Solirubrobacteraceae bacterium]